MHTWMWNYSVSTGLLCVLCFCPRMVKTTLLIQCPCTRRTYTNRRLCKNLKDKLLSEGGIHLEWHSVSHSKLARRRKTMKQKSLSPSLKPLIMAGGNQGQTNRGENSCRHASAYCTLIIKEKQTDQTQNYCMFLGRAFSLLQWDALFCWHSSQTIMGLCKLKQRFIGWELQSWQGVGFFLSEISWSLRFSINITALTTLWRKAVLVGSFWLSLGKHSQTKENSTQRWSSLTKTCRQLLSDFSKFPEFFSKSVRIPENRIWHFRPVK